MEDNQSAEDVKEEIVDYGFVEVDSHDVHQMCMACLCATRTTQMLDDNILKQYYMNILTETQLELVVPVLQSPRLCWECVAYLKRLVCFREQVQDSYRLLQPMLLMCEKEDLNELLRSSVCRPRRLQTYFTHLVDIAPRDEELQAMTADNDDDNGMEHLLMWVKEEGDLNPESAASEWSENNIERRSSTPRETVATIFDCAREDLDELPLMRNHRGHDINDELLEENDARTRKTVKKYVKTVSVQCEVCHKSFARQAHLVTHRRTHTGEKPFQCEVCHKSFAQQDKLVTHRRTHTGEKPFQCQKCHKSFAVQNTLRRHGRTHTGEKPFQCEVCHKSFARKGHLVTHRRTHTGDKPFQCEVCPKSFANKSNLVKHRRAHSEKPVIR